MSSNISAASTRIFSTRQPRAKKANPGERAHITDLLDRINTRGRNTNAYSEPWLKPGVCEGCADHTPTTDRNGVRIITQCKVCRAVCG